MSDLNKELEKQTKLIMDMREDLKQLRRDIAGNPTHFDFLSVCQSINTMFIKRGFQEQPESVLAQWGVTGGESIAEIKELVEEYINHIKDKYSE